MHSATIPLSALATFAAVYWFTPAPAPVQGARSVAEAPAPASVAGASRSSAVPAAKRVRLTHSRAAGRRAAGSHAFRAARRAPAVAVYYPGCNQVRAAGLAPLYRGQPGYRRGMDGDNDGIACEPHRGRG